MPTKNSAGCLASTLARGSHCQHAYSSRIGRKAQEVPIDYEVISAGGSYAGLSAGLALGRARKRTLIIDAGQRRNRFAHEAHGFLGQDGREPGEIARSARAEVGAYPTSTFRDGMAVAAEWIPGGFRVTLGDDSAYTAVPTRLASPLAEHLGCAIVVTPLGPIIRVDQLAKTTCRVSSRRATPRWR